MSENLEITKLDPSLYNEDLAPIEHKDRTWGWFEIFNVWANDIQSLFGYTLAASMFISYGLNGWAVMAAIILAAFFIMILVNLSGAPSVKYGIPYPVMARASMGIRGANFPAMIRAIVAIFWYGVQTYFASTAVTLLIDAVLGTGSDAETYLGITAIGWFSFALVWVFQVYLFMKGIDWIRNFLNLAGPFVYAVMIVLMIVIWFKAGDGLLTAVGDIFEGAGDYEGGAIAAFFTIVGTMIAYFAAVVINFGDFSRFVKDEQELKKGNLWGLPANVAIFSFIALFVTAGTAAIYGENLTNPAEIVDRVDFLPLTIIAAVTFFAATIGINLVANFIPPAYDLANLMPSKIDFRMGGLITAVLSLFVGALWVAWISQIGIGQFVNTLGAVLAPVYGIMIVDYYLIKSGKLDIQQMFSADPSGAYWYDNGWNKKALQAFAIGAVFSIATVWLPALGFLSGFGWVVGALIGGAAYKVLMPGKSA
ncbi:NCS1 family nucleobase:cation symporter-1 [Pelagibius sp. Alg239-R121]|uniref:NCS1 family nucleobase:cation symporter-1 n=1 Tax=Pelagibius sp. Alg239-R121 TaxID=2993448 RepID=UPI0024A699CC|nr:NCS1 family nucleobase:cation symporter-1 [Pelagibius sp. Alg239-R121]